MVDSLNSSPLAVLLLDMIRLQWPTVAANLRNDLMVILQAPVLRPSLICLSVQHERVHRALDLAGYFAAFDLFPPLLC